MIILLKSFHFDNLPLVTTSTKKVTLCPMTVIYIYIYIYMFSSWITLPLC